MENKCCNLCASEPLDKDWKDDCLSPSCKCHQESEAWERSELLEILEDQYPFTALKVKEFIRTLIAKEREAAYNQGAHDNIKWERDADRGVAKAQLELLGKIKLEIEKAIQECHGGGNGRRLLEALKIKIEESL